jgi:hypothetical protein
LRVHDPPESAFTIDRNAQVTLEANRLLPLDGGAAGSDRVVVAHLRMNITAARGLYAALEKALLLAAPAQSDAKN